MSQSKLGLPSQNSVKTEPVQSKLSQNSACAVETQSKLNPNWPCSFETHSQVNQTQSKARKARCLDPPPTWRYACCVQKCNGGAAVVKPGSAAMYADQNPRRCEQLRGFRPQPPWMASGPRPPRPSHHRSSSGVPSAKRLRFPLKSVGHQIIFLFSWTTAQGRVPRTV